MTWMLALLLASPVQEEWEIRCDDAECAEAYEGVGRLSKQISLLNLLNGLHLTADQMKRISELATRAGSLRAETLAEHAATAKEFQAALEELRGRLDGPTGEIPPDLEQNVQRIEGRLNETRRAYLGRLRDLEGELLASLGDGQRRVIEEFNECLIPPKELKDPVRVGEAAGENKDVEELVETMRGLPDRIYARAGGAFLDMMVGFECKVLGEMTADERATEKARLRAVIDRARAMPAPEFAVEKRALAAEVLQRFQRFQQDVHEAADVFIRFSGGMSKAGKWLLNPDIVPVLERRLARAVETAAKTDLDSIDPAESCASCAEPHGAAAAALPKKPSMGRLAEHLGLDAAQTDAARRAIGRGQIELLDLLTLEREDGRVMLVEIFTAAAEGGEPALMRALGEKVPDSKEPYLVRIERIKRSVDRELKEALETPQYRAYLKSAVDLFEVKVGDLRELED